jgi:delta24(24(1))-sterol reductase
VADWTMSFTWGLVVGSASPIPYFYSIFFITVLVHRTTRDFERCVLHKSIKNRVLLIRACTTTRCAIKYGKDWERYCEIVRWKFIPGVY